MPIEHDEPGAPPATFLNILPPLSNFIGMLFISLAKSGGPLDDNERLGYYSLALIVEFVTEFLYKVAHPYILKACHQNVQHENIHGNIQGYLPGHLLISSLATSVIYNEKVLGEKFNPVLTNNPVLDNIVTNMLGHLTFAMLAHLIINYRYFVDTLNRNAHERNTASTLKNAFIALGQAAKALLGKLFKAGVYFSKSSLIVTF
jgi:hypothetical protein